MSRQRWRAVMVTLGALLGASLVLAASSLTDTRAAANGHTKRLAGCQRYFLIPVEWICGRTAYWVNPDGTRVRLGPASELRMPKPLPVKGRP